jgi:hypothetical protein
LNEIFEVLGRRLSLRKLSVVRINVEWQQQKLLFALSPLLKYEMHATTKIY